MLGFFLCAVLVPENKKSISNLELNIGNLHRKIVTSVAIAHVRLYQKLTTFCTSISPNIR
ncbi:hypothetical protein [Nodularia spumigena]|jgi:hypothetical protein|uniref:hypothetical protein n=1 Tax=Nodularia spumigena TaxID=70799 RepID=UPI002B1FC941|nr:hypothetical protein [Nodularia spumigena]MEA5557716.1 hypothetical protein [Nodularia spumigena CH309]